MPDGATLLVFAGAAFALAAIPGPSTIYIATRSAAEGARAGMLSALGVGAGTLLHAAAAAAGVSALVASSATAFSVVRYAGAAYLLALGLRALVRRRAEPADVAPLPLPPRRVFAEAMLVQALNPKVALFFLALLPQFVDPAEAVASQVLVLAAVLGAVGLLTDTAWALTAAVAGRRLRPGTGSAARRASGLVYLALGAAAALSGDRNGG